MVHLDLVRLRFISQVMEDGLSIFHGVLWQTSSNPVKYLRRGKQPGREPGWRLMEPCMSLVVSHGPVAGDLV